MKRLVVLGSLIIFMGCSFIPIKDSGLAHRRIMYQNRQLDREAINAGGDVRNLDIVKCDPKTREETHDESRPGCVWVIQTCHTRDGRKVLSFSVSNKCYKY